MHETRAKELDQPESIRAACWWWSRLHYLSVRSRSALQYQQTAAETYEYDGGKHVCVRGPAARQSELLSA